MARRVRDPTIGQRIKVRRQMHGWSIRFAADRAGLSHATWSRIERGLQSADNRFVVAAIANALECSVSDLTGQPATPVDRGTAAAHAGAIGIRDALIDVDLSEPADLSPRPTEALFLEIDLAADLRVRCDYAGIGQILPRLLRELHAAAAGPDRHAALRLLVDASYTAQMDLRDLGYLGDAWLAAERCRQVAETLDEPVPHATAAFARATTATAVGRYARGLSIASHAIDGLRRNLDSPDALPVFGMLHLIAGFASRGLGQADDGGAWIDEAHDVAAHTGETTAFGHYFGPTNVDIWRISMETDTGEPGRAVEIARTVDPHAIPAVFRHVAYYTDTARALARIRKDREAVRMLLTSERLAPQWVRTAPLVKETVRGILDRAGGSALRGLAERLAVAN